MNQEIEKVTMLVRQYHQYIDAVKREVSQVIVGQGPLVERLIMGILLQGHILLEGVPGLAKTTVVKTLAKVLGVHFKRIQFTPDLLPADVMGTQVYSPKTQEFNVKKGPVFTNILLADEINRAPAKVQSALLEAMAERQVTLGEQTFKLEFPFIVMATQNPIEQEGTYPLPEAQMDRFLFKLHLDYPNFNEELEIMEKALQVESRLSALKTILGLEQLREIHLALDKIYVDPKIKEYIARLVFSSRSPKKLQQGLENYLQFGASPRASICLFQAARCQAFMQGRAFVTPQDVKEVALDVLRHRLILSYEAEAEDMTTDQVIKKILDHVEVP